MFCKTVMAIKMDNFVRVAQDLIKHHILTEDL